MPASGAGATRIGWRARIARDTDRGALQPICDAYLAEMARIGAIPPDTLADPDGFLASRLDASMGLGLTLLLERTGAATTPHRRAADGTLLPRIGGVAILLHERVLPVLPEETLLLSDGYLDPSIRLGPTALPMWHAILARARRVPGATMLAANTSPTRGRLHRLLGWLGFEPSAPLVEEGEAAADSWWSRPILGNRSGGCAGPSGE